MIVAFLLIYFYGVDAWRWFAKRNQYNRLSNINTPEKEKSNQLGEDAIKLPDFEISAFFDEERGIRFVPPVYAQRYMTVIETIKASFADGRPVRKVVDFGCSEMSFFHFLKTIKEVEEILCVDIDDNTLERFACRIMPSTSDFLSRRETPLNVKVLKGSVSEWDSRLKDTNVVVAIELIEHLFPDTLEQLPYSIFGIIQPDIALFTTPNADFNVLFPNFTGFRHDDHKFEWSRQQFIDWANNLASRYPDYRVAFEGIGHGPEGSEQYGCCSQIAVFYRKTDGDPKLSVESEDKETYKLLLEADYPVYFDPRSKEEIIQHEAENFIRCWHSKEQYSVNDRIEIPLGDIMRYVPEFCTPHMLREILSKLGWNVEEVADKGFAVILPYYGLESDNSSEMSENENEHHNNLVGGLEEENWDDSPPNNSIFGAPALDANVPSPGNDSVQLSSVSQQICDKPTVSIGVDQDVEEHRASPIHSESQDHNICTSKPKDVLTRTENSSSESFTRCQSLERLSQNANKNFRYSPCCEDVNLSSVCDIVGAKTVAFSSEKGSSCEEIANGGSCSDAIVLQLEDSCSQSKAGDSGYPNSSERDMDMDLTPEQVDEIVTESESSFEEGDDESVQGEEPRPAVIPQPIHWHIDNMENGDVANNNRDWEGNNMEAEAQIGEALQFEHLIDHRDFAVPLMDAAQEDCESDEDNRYVSAAEYLNTSDDTIVASDDSFNTTANPNNETVFSDPEVRHEGEGSEATAEVIPPAIPAEHRQGQARRVQFPGWLLNVLLDDNQEEDNELGAGDFGDIEELEDDHQQENQEEEEEIVTVEVDVMGGGEPSHTN